MALGTLSMHLWHARLTLAVLWGDFDHVRTTCGSHWSVFEKTSILQISCNDFIQLLGHLGSTLGPILVEIMEDKGRKVKNEPQKGHGGVEWHVQCI